MPPSRLNRGRVLVTAALTTLGVLLSAGLVAAKEPPEDFEHPPHAKRLAGVSQEANPFAVNDLYELGRQLYVNYLDFQWGSSLVAWSETWAANEAARAAAARVPARSVPRSSGVNSGGGGDCYSRAPEGFPDYVIDRESGGDPNATNGAHDGCAQIADSHFNGGACSGMSYDACWSKLWNGGAGASNWSQTL